VRTISLRSPALRWTLAPAVVVAALGLATALPVRGEITQGQRASDPAGPVVVTFGDSVPAGTACDCVAFPDLYARALSPVAASVNLARSGYTSDDVRAQVETAAAQAAVRSATLVLIMVGANDFGDAFAQALDGTDGAEAYARVADAVNGNVAAVVARIRELSGVHLPVLVLGYWNVMADGAVGRADYGTDGEVDARTATDFANGALHRAADQADARYVATDAAFLGPAGDQDPTDLLADDGDHPNAKGHAAIAEATRLVDPDGT
jgi:acyl-CoA thioesterase I